MTVAGHTFDFLGVCTLAKPNGESCPVRWNWIRGCTDSSCVGMKDIAHIGDLNISEIAEIRAEVAREMEIFGRETATASGRG